MKSLHEEQKKENIWITWALVGFLDRSQFCNVIQNAQATDWRRRRCTCWYYRLKKSLCTRWNKNSSNLLKVFLLLKIGKKSRDVKNKMKRMWITWLSDFSTRRHYCLRKSSLHTRWSKLSSNLLEIFFSPNCKKIKRHEEENRRRPRIWIYLSVEFFDRSQFCDAIQNARVTDWRRRRRRKRCHCCLRKSCLH